MNINCIICSDLFTQSDEIYCTPCGHVFHHVCLLQWIERSSTCPQCRKKTTEKNIRKLYFDFLNTEGITQDAGSLQVKLDNAEFSIRQREKDFAILQDELVKVEKKCLQSNEKILNLNEKLKTKEVALLGLKEQVDYLKVESKEATKLRKDNEVLFKQIDLLKGMQEIIFGTISEVEAMAKNTQDVAKLSTYVVVLKRAVMDSESKKKSARDSLHAVQNQITRVGIEKKDLQARVSALETSLSHSDEEIKQLKKHIAELEQQSVGQESAKAVCSECTKRESTKRKLEVVDDKQESNKKIQLNHRPATTKDFVKQNMKVEDTHSPYLNVKQCSNPMPFYLQKKSHSTSLPTNSKASDFSIFRANRLLERKPDRDADVLKKVLNKRSISEISYDGLGGHSKPDVFPVPKKGLMNPALKKPTMKSILRRVERPPNQKTIDDILKPLTNAHSLSSQALSSRVTSAYSLSS